MKLCFGTVFTLLCQIKKSAVNQNLLYNSLVTPTIGVDAGIDSGSVGNRKSGVDDIPKADKIYFLSTEIADITALYRIGLSKWLEGDKYKKAFILALKEILKYDTTISEADNIGSPENTKKAILANELFDFNNLIANLMIYCSSIDNKGYVANVKMLSKDFIKDKLSDVDSIFLSDDVLSDVSSPIIMTVDSNQFASVFKEVNPNSYSLSLPNPNKLKLYKLKITNNEFDKIPVSEFILDNISQYVYSRTKIKNISSTHNIKTISTRAIRDLKSSPNFTDPKNIFCEIMLFSFLESSMSAPKILSGFEVAETSKSSKYSSGIYLLPAGAISSSNQIVFGCTKAHDLLKDAIDDVLNQACEIKVHRSEEIHLLDSSILRTVLEPSVSEYVKNIIIPKAGTDIETDDAFGLFVTYSINIPNKETMSNSVYRDEVKKQMDADIKANLPYLVSQISTLKLSSHSFYLFIMPLDKIEEDTKEIMESAVGGGI